MGEELSTTIKLGDELSGPAKGMSSAIETLAASLNNMAKALAGGDASATATANGLAKVARQAKQTQDQVIKMTESQSNGAVKVTRSMSIGGASSAEKEAARKLQNDNTRKEQEALIAQREAAAKSAAEQAAAEKSEAEKAAKSRSEAIVEHYGKRMDAAFAAARKEEAFSKQIEDNVLKSRLARATEAHNHEASLAEKAANALGLSRMRSQLAASGTKAQGPSGSAFSQVLGFVGKNFGDDASNALLNGAKRLSAVDDSLQKVGLSLGGVASAGLSAVAVGAAAAAAAVLAVVAGVGLLAFKLTELGVHGAIAFTKMTVQTGMVRENALIGLETLLKSRDKASAVYADAVKMAKDTPFETEDIIPAFQKLLAAGFKEDELKDVMTAIGDMAATKGMDKSIIDRLTLVFGQIKGKGKLQGDELMQIAEMGVPTDKIYAEVGKLMGKSTDEVQKLISAGKVDAKTGTTAILNVVKATFGGSMESMSKSLSGLWSTLVSTPFDLFNDALGTNGGGTSKLYDTIKGMVSDLLKALDSGGAKDAVSTINGIASALNAVAVVLRGFEAGLLDGIVKGFKEAGGKEAMGSLKTIKADELAKSMKEVGSAVGSAVAHLVVLVAQIRSIGQNESLMTGLKIGVYAVAVAIGLAATAATALGIAVALATAPFWIITGVVVGAFLGAGLAVVALVSELGKLYSTLSDLAGTDVPGYLGKAFETAKSTVTAAASSLGSAAKSAFMDAFTPSLGGLVPAFSGPTTGSFLPALLQLPNTGYTMSSTTEAPRSSPEPQQTGGQGHTYNLSVALSGVGLDIAGLAALIRSEAMSLFRELGG